MNLPTKDELIAVDFVEGLEYKEFYLAVSEEGIIRALNNKRSTSKKEKAVFTNSNEKLLIFLDNGTVVNIEANIMSRLEEKAISLEDLFNDIPAGKVRVLNILSIKNYDENIDIYFFSKKGMVKKTRLEDFKGDYSTTAAYKFKSEGDKLIAVDYCYSNDNKDVFIATKRALGIRFKSSDVPAMGRIAAGVIGISLKDEDEVLFAALISSNIIAKAKTSDEIALASASEGEILLTTNKKNKQSISIQEIKQQNRAGRGMSLMLVVLDENIKEIKLNEKI